MARTELVLLFVHGRDIDGAAQGLMLHKDTGIGTWQLICSWWPSAMATPTALNGDNHNAQRSRFPFSLVQLRRFSSLPRLLTEWALRLTLCRTRLS
uniref:Uncharacterized protein n=1 Tax=Oryza barthii TaxID=65489 RepID=A0A0D3GP86_9ORYZ